MTRSDELFTRARKCIPGGVNSPVRAFHAVGGTPPFILQADGAWLTDVDGQRYIDYVGSWGPMILGHQHPCVREAILRQAGVGVSFGAPTELEVEMAELLCQRVPGMAQVRLCNSGTEATMSALRLARGFTNRDVILKFEGCYHGHSDALLVKAGSGALTIGVPTSPGVPDDFAKFTLTATYNDLDSVEHIFRQNTAIAAVIVEPIAGNMNCIPPEPGFLEGLRRLCDDYGALLIFDEVMTGFRVHPKGASGYFGITPDLITLGKIIGGGLPVGAFGGRRDVMQKLAPAGPVYQAGTLSGNPLAMAAGLATLRYLSNEDIYRRLDQWTGRFIQGLKKGADQFGVPFFARHIGSMFGIFFTQMDSVDNFADANAGDRNAFRCFFHEMLKRGIYLAPSPFEAGFVSLAHDEYELQMTLDAATHAFRAITEL